MPRVLAAIGPESLGELLTEIALEHWPAAAVGDVLPALHVLDPEEADEPAVAIALDRAGSWAGLLALTSRELVDQPFIQARPVLNTLFSAVLVRLAHPHGDDAPAPVAPAGHGPGVVAEHPHAADEPEAPAAALGREGVGEEEVPEPVAVQHAAEGVEEAAAAHLESATLDEELEWDEREPVVDADDEPVADEAPEPEPERVLDAADEPAPEPAAQEAEALQAEAFQGQSEGESEADARAEAVLDADADHDADADREHDAEHDAEHSAEADREAEAEQHAETDQGAEADHGAEEDHGAGEDQGVEGEPEPDGQDRPLPQLIEAAFAGLDDKSWAVAQNRVFTDEPSAVDQLAKLFAVPPAEISATEDELRARLDRWLSSDEAAPYRAHLDELTRTLGPAAPKEQVINAADWHSVEIQALEVPAWQFVLTTLAPPPPPPPAAELPPPPLPQRKPYQQQPQPPVELVPSAFGPVGMTPQPPPGPPQFQAFTPAAQPMQEANGEQDKPYQPLKDVSQTRRCFRQPDGRWWLRIDVTAEQLAGGECVLPTGFASYLGLSPGESRTVRSAAGELSMVWHGKPILQSIERLLVDVGAREGGHLFLTLSDEGVLRARHLPVAAQGAEKITKALRLVGYTAPGGTRDQAARVIATRIGMTGPVALPDLLNRLRERGDRDLLELLD
ncbi:hypothetical protein FXF51_42435 [Nonomuraea sp. PA05]|uniref:hypothetical protein n=1 Tax=Nonomuraea sp. PA05 TaxID=2604466 RepID=UPI0011D9E90B|nr:hypothetical protein [Nonomuraea sp. PA05]TYB56772.1 hypothetical protein FXF51_42435 [Nonomuraea sp. PA05]